MPPIPRMSGVEFIRRLGGVAATEPARRNRVREPIAITGIGCRFPGGVNDPATFWRLLADGGDAITEVPPDRWSINTFYDRTPGRVGKTISKWGGFLDGIDQFDPAFFGISPREAECMDPQHRLLLMASVEAMDDAGVRLDRESEAGVFVGISTNDYAQLQLSPTDHTALDPWSATGGVASIAANRISHSLNLRGPSFAVDTACSSSLVALHLACRSLENEECPVALVGGVNALLLPTPFVSFSRSGMLSPDGRCKAFDARANGFVRAEGVGVIVLKPLSAALAGGSPIYAVIRGTAINQDGGTGGISVPNIRAQEAVVREACLQAGVALRDVQYVEAHGTGTGVGDPIEAAALGATFGAARNGMGPCVIGSVKTNIGHLEAGAGIAGVIKTALSLFHGTIPASLHFETPNPQIDFAKLNLRVARATEPFDPGSGRLLAGVNSFGFGGANAHTILEAPPARRACTSNESQAHLLTISAKSTAALRDAAAKYRAFIADAGANASLSDVCFTAGTHRTHHPHRLALAARTREEFAEKLEAFAAGEQRAGATDGQPLHEASAPVFVFSGQGPQWWGMGRELLAEEPVFRAKIEECDGLIRKFGHWSLLQELSRNEATSRMQDTAIAQPAIFSLQMALVALWESWGIRPAAVVGHSVGEVAAACVSGVLTLRDAMHVIVQRGRCMSLAAKNGRMLAAGLSPRDAEEWMKDAAGRVEIGSLNAPRSIVLSGDGEVLEAIEARMQAAGVFCRWLPVHYAFHSHQMDPIRGELIRALGRFKTHPPVIPAFSTVSGSEISAGDFGPEYWWLNVRQPVQFAAAFEALAKRGHHVFLEVGPHPVLGASMVECLKAHGVSRTVLPSLRRKEPERATMLGSLGALHVLGSPVNWKALSPAAEIVRLPSYPWQTDRYWHESEEWTAAQAAKSAHPLLTRSVKAVMPTWETRLDLHALPYLADHRVHGRIVFPAAAYVEMALGAAITLGRGKPVAIDEIEFQAALFLSEKEKPPYLQLAFDPQQSDFTIAATRDGIAWTVHVNGRLGAGSFSSTEEAIDLLRQKSTEPISGETSRQMFHETGLDFGPAFSGVEVVYKGDGEALGRVILPPHLDATGHQVHPGLLDACFQVLSHALPVEDAQARRLFLPVQIEQVRFFERPEGPVWSHARLVRQSDRSIVGDLHILDENGRLLIEIRGFRCQAVSSMAHGRGAADDWCHEFQWELKPLRAGSALQRQPAMWLLFADRKGLANGLTKRFTDRGDRAVTILIGPAFCRRDDVTFEIRPGSRDDLQRVIAEVRSAALPIAGAIHLWNLDAAAPADLSVATIGKAEEEGCCSLVPLLQVLTQEFPDAPPRLWVATRAAQAVLPGDPVALAQAPIWGVGRVVMNELPRLACRLVDFTPGGADEDADLLLREIDFGDGEEEIAYREGARYANRLAKVSFEQRHIRDQPPVEVASYRLAVGASNGIDQLALRTAARRAPGPGEVEIEVEAAGLNFRDVLKALGIYPSENPQDTLLGDECAGRVVAVGEAVGDFKVGDEVVAMAPGSFGSHLTLPASSLARKPPALTPEEAATLPVAFITAWYALHELGRLRRGERVLIHAAAGGVGLAAVQVAQLAGAEIFATAGSPEKRDYLRSLGVAHVMDSRSLAFADEVRTLTDGEGVDIVLNSLSGEAIAKGISCLRSRGRFLEIGKRDIFQNAKLGLRPFRNNISFFAIDLAQVLEDDPAFVQSLLQQVLALVADGKLQPLRRSSFRVSEFAEAFRHMSQARHIGKIVLTLEPGHPIHVPRSPDTAVRFKADATYLITGGLSGFGLSVAEWMLRNGAHHLVLVSRSGPASGDTQQAVARLRELGGEVLALAVDVTREQDIEQLFATIDRQLPPLRGVIHSAMVIDDSMVLQQDSERFRRVMAPKVTGAWHLHTQTAKRELDFFVLFSSFASVVGNAGQASYAAANAFLDALAHYRHGCSLPASVINWGVLGEVGFVARNSALDASLRSHGVDGFAPAEAMAILGQVIQSSAVQVGAFRIDWQKLAPVLAGVATSPRYAALFADTAPAHAADSTALEAILALPESERLAALTSEVAKQVAHVLRTSAGNLDAQRPLGELGMDSLMSVELMNRLELCFQISLPQTTIVPGVSVAHLAGTLLKTLDTPPACADRDGTAPGAADSLVPNARQAATDDHSPAPWLATPSAQPELGGWSGKFLQARFRLESLALRGALAYFERGDFQRAQRHLTVGARVLRLVLRHDWHWALKNLKLIFGPNLSERERVRLAALAFEHHLNSYLEGLRHADVSVEFHHHERLLEAHAAGRGVILCGVHLGSWESVLHDGPQAGLPIVGVYRRALNPLSNAVFQEIRSRYRIEWIASEDVAGIVQALRAGKIVGLMTDLNTPAGGTVADFLGLPVTCPAGPARLALMHHAPLLPAVAVRTGTGRVSVHFEAAIEPPHSGSFDADTRQLTARINQAFEPWVLEYAEQYNWLHPRWRNRPDGRRWSNDVSEAEMCRERTAPFMPVSERVRRLIAPLS